MNNSSVITEIENKQTIDSTVSLHDKCSNCKHCGIVISDRNNVVFNDNGDVFCCWGCETVYKILSKEGFSLINKPSASQPEYDFLDNESFLKDYLVSNDNRKGMRFFVEGIQCTACVWIIDQIPDWVPQVENVHLNMSQNTLFVSLREPGYFGKVASVLSALGYKAYPIKSLDEAKHFQKKENHQQLMRLGIAAACTGNIMLFSFSLYSGLKGQMAGIFGYLNLAFFLPILFYCAQPFYRNLWRSMKAGRPSIDLPIVAAVIIGFVLSLLNLIRGNDDFYFDSLSILIFLLLASRYLLSRTQQTFINSSYMQTFIDSQVCQRWNDKSEEYDKIPARLLNVDDKVLIKEGERVPADGIVLNEWVNINPSILTGESLPQKLFKNSVIYAGTQVVAGYAKILVKHTAGNSRIGQILKKVEEQIYNKTPLISLTDRAAQYFSIFILVAGAVFFSFYINVDPTEAVKRTLALIILACPCALAFATPLTQSLSLKKASKKGYLIKNAESLEKLNNVKNAFFDKTGTLTEAKMKLASLYTLESLRDDSKETTQDDKTLLTMAVLASDAFVEEGADAPRKLTVHGRPIEKAVVVAGLEMGLSQDELEKENKRIDFLKFESKNRFGASLNKHKEYKRNRVYFSGEPESLLDYSTHVLKNGKVEKLSAEDYASFKQIQKKKSAEGMRFIGISYKDVMWEDISEGVLKNKKSFSILI